MKQIIKKLILGVISLGIITSCSNFIDQEVQSSYSPEIVFNSEEGAELALNGLFVTLSSGEYYGSSWHGLLNPHSGRMYSRQGASMDATSLNCGTNNTWLTRLWPQMYQTIGVANNIIAGVENSNLKNKNTTLGQAYFVRGLVYFDLVRLFGGVPLRTKPATSQTLYLPRSSKEEVYKLIIEDFTKAKQLLPDFGQYANKERPVKWAAYGYLAKVYMQLAGESGGDGNLDYWKKAWDEASQVYGKYSLRPNYNDLFKPGIENTEEAIFEIQYGQFSTIRNADIVRMYTPGSFAGFVAGQIVYPYTTISTFGWIRPNKETFDSHFNQYPGDPRIDATYIYNLYFKYNSSGAIAPKTGQPIYPKTNVGTANGFPYIRKWMDPNYTGTTTQRNVPVFRYADLLLMLAEIENEINGPANAYQYVNLVLDRARKSVTAPATPSLQPVNWSGMTKEQFRDRIMQERKFELLSEGQDWFDARRRGYQYFLDKTLLPHNNHPTFYIDPDPTKADNSDIKYPVDMGSVKKNMLLPIPLTEISSNPSMSSADQNPGY